MVMTHLIINPCKITAFVILQPSCTTTALTVKEPAQPKAHFRAPRAVNCKRIESSASAGLKSCLKLYVQKILAVNILLSDAERVDVVFCSDAYLKDTSQFSPTWMKSNVCILTALWVNFLDAFITAGDYLSLDNLGLWNTESNFKIGVLGPCLFNSTWLCVTQYYSITSMLPFHSLCLSLSFFLSLPSLMTERFSCSHG